MFSNVASGEIKQQINYDAFGDVLTNNGEALTPFGYAGGLADEHTELIRFGARDYNPAVGSWTAKDPIIFEGGDFNLYGYVLNDPVNSIDPNGKFSAHTQQGLRSLAWSLAFNAIFDYAFTGELHADNLLIGAFTSFIGGNIGSRVAAKLFSKLKVVGNTMTPIKYAVQSFGSGFMIGFAQAGVTDYIKRGKFDTKLLAKSFGAGLLTGFSSMSTRRMLNEPFPGSGEHLMNSIWRTFIGYHVGSLYNPLDVVADEIIE